MNKPCARCGVMMTNVHRNRKQCSDCSSNSHNKSAWKHYHSKPKCRINEHPLGYPNYLLAYWAEYKNNRKRGKKDYVSTNLNCPSWKHQNKIGILA